MKTKMGMVFSVVMNLQVLRDTKSPRGLEGEGVKEEGESSTGESKNERRNATCV